MHQAVQWAAWACLVARWSLAWVDRWVVWVPQAVPLLVLRVAVNLHLGVHRLVAALLAVKVVQAVPRVADKMLALAVPKAVLLPAPAALAVRKRVAQADSAGPALKVAGLAAPRVVVQAVRAAKAAMVGWPWPHPAATPKCAVVSQGLQGPPHRVPMV